MEIKNIPEDVSAEKAILGAIILEQDSIKDVIQLNAIPDRTIGNARKMIEAGKRIQELGYSSLDSKDAVDKAQHLIMRLSSPNYGEPIQEASVADLFKSCLNRIITSNYRGIDTGINTLDLMTNGLHSATLISLKGKAGCGKTALALQIMVHIASVCKVVYITDKIIDDIALRLVCTLAEVSSWKFKTNKMQDSEWQKIQEAAIAEKNNNMGLYSFTASVIELVSRIRDIYSVQKMQVLILDLKLVLQTEEMLKKLKELAEELNIVILLLIEEVSGEKKTTKFICDICLILKMKKNKHKLIVTKHDGGPTGSIDLSLDKDLLLFSEHDS